MVFYFTLGKVRKIWQRRLCEIRESQLYIYHSDKSKTPVTVPLLLCQVRPLNDDPRCFDLVSCKYDEVYFNINI